MPEALAYRPTSSGHDSEPRESKNYVQPRQELVDALDMWLSWVKENNFNANDDEAERMYGRAVEILPDMSRVTDAEVNSMLGPFEDRDKFSYSGLFVSAAYNMMGQDELVFNVDFETPLCWLGENLGESKTLTIKNDTNHVMGRNSRGTLVNMGNAKYVVGNLPEGLFINHGNVFRVKKRNATILNYGKITDVVSPYWHNKGMVINYGAVGILSHGKCPLLNYGHIGNVMAGGVMVANMGDVNNMSSFTPGTILEVKRPKKRTYERLRLLLEEDECRKMPGLLEYMENIRTRFGRDRTPQEIGAELERLDVRKDVKGILRKGSRPNMKDYLKWMASFVVRMHPTDLIEEDSIE